MLNLQPPAHIISLIVGPPGSGKSVFARQLAYELASEGGAILYLSTDRSAQEIVSRMNRQGWSTERFLTEGRFRLVDLYSWQVDGNERYEETPYGWRLCPVNTVDLQRGIQIMLDRINAPGLRRVIADSLTTLTSMIGEKTAIKTVRTIGSRVREVGGGVGTLCSAVHSESFQTEMATIFDLIIELRIDATKNALQRSFRVAKYTEGSQPDSSIPFTITDQGIEIGSLLSVNRSAHPFASTINSSERV